VRVKEADNTNDVTVVVRHGATLCVVELRLRQAEGALTCQILRISCGLPLRVRLRAANFDLRSNVARATLRLPALVIEQTDAAELRLDVDLACNVLVLRGSASSGTSIDDSVTVAPHALLRVHRLIVEQHRVTVSGCVTSLHADSHVGITHSGAGQCTIGAHAEIGHRAARSPTASSPSRDSPKLHARSRQTDRVLRAADLTIETRGAFVAEGRIAVRGSVAVKCRSWPTAAVRGAHQRIQAEQIYVYVDQQIDDLAELTHFKLARVVAGGDVCVRAARRDGSWRNVDGTLALTCNGQLHVACDVHLASLRCLAKGGARTLAERSITLEHGSFVVV
jgi:hypothetical protein